MILSSRLEAIYNLVEINTSFIDVGCDHCYLTIKIVKYKQPTLAIASDINKIPLASCNRNLINNNLADKVQLLLNDGLKGINNQIKTIIISGMGGNLIVDILSNYQKKLDNKTFILQPNNSEYNLRLFLQQKNLKISSEIVVENADRYYTVIKVDATGKIIKNKRCLFLGPLLQQNYSKEVVIKNKTRLNWLLTFINQISDNKRKSFVAKEIYYLKEYLLNAKSSSNK